MPGSACVDVGSLAGTGVDVVSSASAIQAAPDGQFYILINRDRHPDEEVLADWVVFFEDREAAPLIMEDISAVVCEGDEAGLEMATSLQSRLAENQMTLRVEQAVLATSKVRAGLFDAMVVSEAVLDAYEMGDVCDQADVVVIER